MALNSAVQVGKHALQGGFGALLALGAVTNGGQCISGRKKSGGSNAAVEVEGTAKKVQNRFLSGVLFVGQTAGLLGWAHFCEWISLGAAAPISGVISFSALGIASLFDLFEKCVNLKQCIGNSNLEYHRWQIGIECLRVVSQVCLIASYVLGATAMITGNLAFLLAAGATAFSFGFLWGVAYQLTNIVDKWEPQAALAT